MKNISLNIFSLIFKKALINFTASEKQPRYSIFFIFPIVVFVFVTIICGESHRSLAETTSTVDIYLPQAFALADTIGASQLEVMKNSVVFSTSVSPNSPLAQYQPMLGGKITLGNDLHRYHKEFVVLGSKIERIDRPDFNQYMVVLTLLSLSNENAHFIQHHNGSLDDFYTFLHDGDQTNLCTLYALQQHVSDIEMLDTALRLELYFLGHGSIKGIKALRIVLEKMELNSLFEDFRDSYRGKDSIQLKNVLDRIFQHRVRYNMSSLSQCKGERVIQLDRDIYDRAIEPARMIFLRSQQYKSSSKKYNQ